jgi:hypothetical protein
MIVFSEGERTREGVARAGESMFAYLDSSARREVCECRSIVEKSIADYPQDKLLRWIGDFRSSDDVQHFSAFFELFLFRFFQRDGWKVLEVEPQIDGVLGSPDFLIEGPNGSRIVVEAIVPNEKPDEERRKQKLIDDIKEAINAVRISDHYLILDAIEAPTQAIDKAKLVRALNRWIDENPGQDDVFEYRDRGALVSIKVFPRPGRNTESPQYRAIGVEMGGVSVSTPGDHVKKGLEKKAAKYRELQLPYVIALNARAAHDTEDDYLAATYGTQALRYSIGPDGPVGEPEWIRNSDGLFNDGGKPRKQHVSAVLLFNGVAPWNWYARRSCMIHNAFANKPLGDVSFGGDAFVVDDDVLTKVEGRNVGDLLEGAQPGTK